MKVDNNTTTSTEFAQKVRQQRQNLLNSLSQEDKKLQETHQIQKEKTREAQNVQLMDLKEQTHSEMNQFLLDNQKKLAEHRDHLHEETQRLDTEKDLLSKNHKMALTNMNFDYDEKHRELFSDSQRKIDSIQNKSQEYIKKIDDQAQREIEGQRFDSKIAIDNNARSTQRLIQKQNGQYDLQAKSAGDEHRRKLELQKLEQVSQINRQKFLNQSELTQRENIHHDELKALKNQQTETLKQEKLSFEQKFENLKKSHQAILDRINNQLRQQTSGILKNFSSEKTFIENRAEDPFYRVTEFSPTIEDNQSEYIVSLKIPEHESDKVRLTARDRLISLSLSREYHDQIPDEKGGMQSTKRSETLYSKHITKNILDGKKIQQRYMDGILSFIIAKK